MQLLLAYQILKNQVFSQAFLLYFFAFQGGFPDSPIRSESIASRESSLSDAESESPPPTAISVQGETQDSRNRIERQSPSPPCTSGKENGKIDHCISQIFTNSTVVLNTKYLPNVENHQDIV